MLQFEELRLTLLESEKPLKDLAEALGLEKMREEITALEAEAARDGFWDDLENSQKVLQRTSALKNKVADYENIRAQYEDTLTLIELANEEEDESLLDECRAGVKKVQDEIDRLTLTTLLSG